VSAVVAALCLAGAVAAGGGRPQARRAEALARGIGHPSGIARHGPGGPPADQRVARTVVIPLALGLVAVALAVRVPVAVVVIACGSSGVAWRGWRRRTLSQERTARRVAIVEVTFALAGELRAGRTPTQALASVARWAGPLRPVLEAAAAADAVGGDGAEELAHGAELAGAERLRYVAAAWSAAGSVGARVAVVLERLSEAMDSDADIRRELDAALAGPRATAGLLTALPLLGLALGQAVGANPLDLLLHRPLGWGLLAAATCLDAVGVVLTRGVVRAALRG
jgi:tight adherence protein B